MSEYFPLESAVGCYLEGFGRFGRFWNSLNVFDTFSLSSNA